MIVTLCNYVALSARVREVSAREAGYTEVAVVMTSWIDQKSPVLIKFNHRFYYFLQASVAVVSSHLKIFMLLRNTPFQSVTLQDRH